MKSLKLAGVALALVIGAGQIVLGHLLGVHFIIEGTGNTKFVTPGH